MRLTPLLIVLTICFTPFLGCGGGASGPAKPTAEQSEIEKFLAENPELDSDEANEIDTAE